MVENKTTVVKVTSAKIISTNLLDPSANYKISADLLDLMLDSGMKKLLSGKNSLEAWKHFFEPKDVVGLKVNTLAGKPLSTHPELTNCIVQALLKTGLKKENIYIWDRNNRELSAAGFKINKGRGEVQCYGTETNGIGYDSSPSESKNFAGCLSRFMSSICNKTISVPILKDHSLAGLSGSMKNFFGAIHNPNKHHDNNCSPYVADLYCLDPFRKGVVLHIVDALLVQYNGGPGFKPSWTVPYGALILGTDPVAVDACCLDLVDNLRQKYKLPTLQEANRFPKFLPIAADSDHKLGVFDRNLIDLKEVKI